MAKHVVGQAEVAEASKQVEAAKSFTSKESLIEHFGEERIVQSAPDKPYEIKLETYREWREFCEMDTPRARLESRAAQESYAKVPTVLLQSSSGKQWEVPEELSKGLCESALGRSLGVHEVARSRRNRIYRVAL